MPGDPVTIKGWTVQALCPNCAGTLQHITTGRPQRFDTRAIARCTRPGCQHTWLVAVTLTNANELSNTRRKVA
jgi:hypothetical protein